MDLKLGLGLFWFEMTYEGLVEIIEEAEALGYDGIWADNEKFYRYMYVTATVIAEHTRRVKVGTHVADPYTLHPALTAMAIGTLDAVTHGRAVLIIGAGGTGFPEMGIERRKPARAIKEAIQVIRCLWKGQVVDFQGEVIHFNRGRLNFEARPDIPIFVASRGDLVLETAGQVADGVMIATYAEPKGISHALSIVEKGARQSGRTLKDLTVISRCDLCMSPDRRLAYDSIKPNLAVALWTSYPDRKFAQRSGLKVPDKLEEIIATRDYNLMLANAHLVPDEFVDTFCWAGTPEDVVQKIARIAKMGINNFSFLPHPPRGGSILYAVREMARTVKPSVEAMVNGG